MHTVHIKMNVQCVVLRTDNITVYTFSEGSYSNFLSSINLIDMCTCMDKTIYSSIKYSSKLVDNPVITLFAS